ncbi:hypothetical protein LINPERPRIM_LOCUS9355 [Linum perenne]
MGLLAYPPENQQLEVH